MGTALAILMVLGIFVGVPALVGFAIASTYILKDRRVRRAERGKAAEEMAARPTTRTIVGATQKR